MFNELHTSVRTTSHNLNKFMLEQEQSWTALIKTIKSPSFLELAQYVRPNVIAHPMNAFYTHFLNAQIEQTQYTHKFWEKLTSNDYLLIENQEDEQYLKYFHSILEINGNLLVEMFNFYIEHNKPLFFSNIDTDTLRDTFELIKSYFLIYLKEGYISLSNDHHHEIDENQQKYFYTGKRFFPSYPHSHKIFSYINDKTEEELYPKLSFEQKGLVSKIFQSVFYNEKFFHEVFYFFVNIFNEEASLNALNSIGSFPIVALSEMSSLYFDNNEINETNFQKIQNLIDNIQNKYGLRSYYNLISENTDEGVNILKYSPNNTIDHLLALDKHLSSLQEFSHFNNNVNSQMIIGSHIPLSYDDVLPVACFSHVFKHKLINCHFWDFQKKETQILAHEYQHLLDNLFLNQITDTSTEDAHLFHVSSTFPSELQQIFSKGTYAEYSNTLFDHLSSNKNLSTGYSCLFQNFLYSVFSKFEISQEILDNNKGNIDLLSNIHNLVSPHLARVIFDNYKQQLLSTQFSDEIYNQMAHKVVTTYFQETSDNKIYDYMVQRLERSIINACISKFTPYGINLMLSDFNNDFEQFVKKLHDKSPYEKELFLLPLQSKSYDEIIKNLFFADLLSIHYSIGNAICKSSPQFTELFTYDNINPYSNITQIMNEDSFIVDFTNAIFKQSCLDAINIFTSLSDEISSLMSVSNNIELISISVDSDFNKTYFPIPFCVNSPVHQALQEENINYGIYLNYPSEILARSAASLFQLSEYKNSPFFSLLHARSVVVSSIDKSENVFSLTLKNFTKENLNQMSNNYVNFLSALSNDIKENPRNNVSKYVNPTFLPTSEENSLLSLKSLTNKRKSLKK